MFIMTFSISGGKVSTDEKRVLKERPKLSFGAVISGKYTKDYEDFLSDNFPLRNMFIKVSKTLTDAIQLKNKEGVVLVAKDAPSDLGAGETLEAIKPSQSPTTKPQPTPVPIVVDEASVLDQGNIIIVGNRAMETFFYSKEKCTAYASIINSLATKLPNIRIYSLLIPTSIEFYSPPKYHSLSQSQKDAIDYIYNSLVGVSAVDAYGLIAANTDKYLYFRTDHHWTALGAYQAYVRFCEKANIEPSKLEGMQNAVIENFVGTMYGYTQSEVLKNNPDTVEVYYPPIKSVATAYQAADMLNGSDIKLIYRQLDSTTNKYLAFLGGDHPLIHIVSENKNGKKLLITKDSFGNALIPFLSNNYEEIFVIDPRSILLNLPQFAVDHQINDIIIENYSFAVTNTKFINGLNSVVNPQ